MHYFRNEFEASEYLNISIKDFRELMKSYNTTLAEFLCIMRIEDAKGYLMEKPGISDQDIAAKCGFESVNEYLRLFFTTEKCSPEEWIEKNGIIYYLNHII